LGSAGASLREVPSRTGRNGALVFLFFNSRMGCLGSIVISAIVTIMLLAVTGVLHF